LRRPNERDEVRWNRWERKGIAISKEIGRKEVRKDCDERATYEGS